MNRLTAQSIELLRRMIRIPSESFREEKVVSLVEDALSSFGLSPCRYGNNLVCVNRGYDPQKPTLVLDAHLDTVPPSDGYTRDPLEPGDDPEIVWGLGSNDDGASAVSMIAAFRHFYEEDMPINLSLDLNCEEERSGPDGDCFLFGPDGPSQIRDAAWVIVGEPTGMDVATSERGLLVLDGLAVGVSGHAARHEGVNALYIALDDIQALRGYEFSRISPIMGKVGLNVTQISCGSAHNVIPDKCSFVVDIRPTEQYSNEEIVAELQAICKSTLIPRNLRNKSSATYTHSPLEKTATSLGMKTFSSPTTSNWMRTGKDAVKMGPGNSSRSHHADEYILCSEVEDAVDKYIRFIETFYGNTLE